MASTSSRPPTALTTVSIPSDHRALPTSTAFVPLTAPALAYTQSSQFQNWRFGRAQLEALRSAANEGARRRIGEAWAVQAGGEGNGEGQSSQTLPFPSAADEKELVQFYLGKVPALTRALGLPDLVAGAAMSFMKRFYLRNSCLEWHPKHIMLTCLFLATKTENVPISLHSFASRVAGNKKAATKEAAAAAAAAVEENAQTIRSHEFLVSQSLQFEFMLWPAARALGGLLADLQSVDPPLPLAKYQELAGAAQELLALSRMTDAEFLYTPAQIALVCARAAEARVLSSSSSSKQAGSVPAQETNDSAAASASTFGMGALGPLTKPYLLGKEARARSAAASARKERDALREVDEERLRRILPQGGADKGDAAKEDDGEPGGDSTGATRRENPALALQFKDGSLLGVLDECAGLLLAAETALKAAAVGSSSSGQAAERLERVKRVDRDIKACKPPSSSTATATATATAHLPASSVGPSSGAGGTSLSAGQPGTAEKRPALDGQEEDEGVAPPPSRKRVRTAVVLDEGDGEDGPG